MCSRACGYAAIRKPCPNYRRRAKECIMSKEQDNKAIVGRWFTEFWGTTWNPAIVDELCTADILLQYSLHAPRRGCADVKAEDGEPSPWTAPPSTRSGGLRPRGATT